MKDSIPKVSVIVPVYNVPEHYLKKCVNSLVNQTLKDLEIILIDDGTFETSGKICDELARNDKRIIVIHQNNKGLCGARNAGVKASTGEWISFVDGDDFIDLDTYEKLYLESKKIKDLDVIMFGFVKDYPNKSVAMNYNNFLENGKLYSTSEEIKYLQKMILNYNANIATVTTKFIRNEFIKNNNLYHDEKLRQGAEGIEFNIRLFSVAKKVKFIQKRFYHYIYNDKSITTKHDEKNHKMVLNCFKKIKEEIDTNDEEIMKWFYNRMKYVILTTAISGYFSDTNPENYFVQKKKFKKYLEDDLVKETLKNNNFDLSIIRNLTLFFIKYKLFLCVKIISKIRKKQKDK